MGTSGTSGISGISGTWLVAQAKGEYYSTSECESTAQFVCERTRIFGRIFRNFTTQAAYCSDPSTATATAPRLQVLVLTSRSMPTRDPCSTTGSGREVVEADVGGRSLTPPPLANASVSLISRSQIGSKADDWLSLYNLKFLNGGLDVCAGFY